MDNMNNIDNYEYAGSRPYEDFASSRQNDDCTQDNGQTQGFMSGGFDSTGPPGNKYGSSHPFSQGGVDRSVYGSTGESTRPLGGGYHASDPNTGDFGPAYTENTGNMGSTGLGGQDDDSYGQNAERYNNNSMQNKPSMSNKIKGTAQELIGKVTKNPTKEKRGLERKTGEFETSYD